MTRSAPKMRVPPEKLPVLIAAASILQISESLFPHPLPGLRFGLANILSLIVLCRHGFQDAFTITIVRTIVTSLVMGSFLSPGFFLSFSGGLVSICVVGGLHHLSLQSRWLAISPVVLGIVGAFTHNMVQLGLAYTVFFRHAGLFFLTPWLCFGSVFLGAVSGGICVVVLRHLDQRGFVAISCRKSVPPLEDRVFQPGDSWLYRIPAGWKVTAGIFFTQLLVVVENVYVYVVIFLGILALIPMASLSYRGVFSIVKRVKYIALGAFFLPLCWHTEGGAGVSTPLGTLDPGITMGLIFSGRMLLLALFSMVIARTTQAAEMAAVIAKVLRPMGVFGLESKGLANTITRSLTLLPETWKEVRTKLVFATEGKPKNYHTVKLAVEEVFVWLFSGEGGISCPKEGKKTLGS